MDSPNVVYLILDCLREDAITASDAPNIRTLADRNVSFEACVTPANWSLPSHVSLFTGEWPHDHGYFKREHYPDSLPLIETLQDKGYETVGASANVFASSTYGFDRGFDRFFETRRPLNPRGLNPFAHVRRIRNDGTARPSDYAQTFVDSLTHDRPVASVDNFARSVLLSLDRRFGLRQYLPGFDDDNYGFLARASGRTTDFLVDEIERAADREAPLFAFANYMDTHYPYQPPARHFREVTDGEYDLSDLRAIEPDISHSQEFRNAAFGGTLDEEALDLVRAAYRAEVRSVDERVGQLLQALEAAGIREETIIVITADHGECLGETDLRDERVMGHFDGLSEHLWTVPLIVANPNLDEETVERRTSLKSLFDLLTADLGAFLDEGGRGWATYFDDDPIFFELPADPLGESSLRSYSNLPDWFVERVTETHTVVGFDGEWTVVVESTGGVRGFHGGDAVDASSLPSDLRTACADAVAALQSAAGPAENNLSDGVAQQLEDLGYV